MSATAPLARRLVAVFDPYAPDAHLLDLALRLGSAAPATLHALFVEETEAVALGSLPWAREITLATGRARPIEPATVERALRRSAASARALFDTIGAGLSGSQFEQVRGSLATELARVGAGAAAVLLGWPPAPRRSRAWARMITGVLAALPVPIVGLVAPSTTASGILVVEVARQPGTGRELAARLSTRPRERIAVQHGPSSAGAVMESARRELCDTLLIERGAAKPDEFLGDLALRWSGSLLLVD